MTTGGADAALDAALSGAPTSGSRRAGWGGQLLVAAERLARQRGCERLFVSSFTLQVPVFHERHGYRQCARVEDYPVGCAADVYLVKDL